MSKDFVCSACDLFRTNDRNKIIVHGARERNLKNICFEIPKGKLIALTGPSGSGKSSIAVEVLQKECLRQFLESLGMTTDHITKAKVDQIMGLSPAIGVSQRITDFNPRSTVGTKTGILTIFRNLFASIGRQVCAGCGKKVKQPALRWIQEAGNTVLIIEHDPEVIKHVDYILEIGPGGGSQGGQIVVSGTPTEVLACTTSIGKHLAKKPHPYTEKALTIHGASEHNLKNIDVHIPVNQFVVMTGVSGSGKSTLLFDILDKAARKHFNGASEEPGKHVARDRVPCLQWNAI